MKKMEAYRLLEAQGRAAGFLANVVLCHHRNPARRLKALARLVQLECDVRTGGTMDTLLVDGGTVSWTDLDTKSAEEIKQGLADSFARDIEESLAAATPSEEEQRIVEELLIACPG